MEMKAKIKDYIQKNQMIPENSNVLVALSGGADSVCLLLMLLELSQEMDFGVEAIHVEHGIRGEESKEDARFVEALCDKYEVPLYVAVIDVPTYAAEKRLGTEEAARILRYKALEEYARRRSAIIALAHHMDDNAETILFQMVRGSGMRGLIGIKPIRKDNGLVYIRPLLCLKRLEIEDYLALIGQEYCTDKTNADVTYSRNRIRKIVMPELNRINPQSALHFNKAAEQLAEVMDFVENQVQEKYDEIVNPSYEGIMIDAEKLKGLHSAIQHEVALKIIADAALQRKDITSKHVQDFIDLADKQSGKKINLPYGLVAEKQYGLIVLTGKKEEIESDYEECEISREELERGFILHIDDDKSVTFRVFDFDGDMDKIPKKSYTKWLDYGKIKEGLKIRNRRPGDFFINDDKDHRKKLKEYFIDEKIPVSERNSVWVLADGMEVVCIIGKRIGEPYKILPGTRKVLEILYKE